MFEVGDKIVHPSHGAGIIKAVEKNDVLDEFNRYYVIELTAQEMRVMVPVRMAEEIGLRKVAGSGVSKEVTSILSSDAQTLPDDFKKRQAELMAKLREGDVQSLAEVVRDMTARSLEKTYSPTEARLFDQAKSMLSGELALARDTDLEEALAFIDRKTLGQEPG